LQENLAIMILIYSVLAGCWDFLWREQRTCHRPGAGGGGSLGQGASVQLVAVHCCMWDLLDPLFGIKHSCALDKYAAADGYPSHGFNTVFTSDIAI
jgi:hypothetical protein